MTTGNCRAGMLDELLRFARSKEFLMLSAIFLIYLSNPVVRYSTDSIPIKYLPLSMIRERNFDLDEFTFLYESKDKLPYYLKNVDGRVLSLYPVFTSVLALPVYLLPVLAGLDPRSDDVLLLSRTAAALMTAISCLFVYWTLKRMASEKTALLVTAVYGFGTATWQASQDLGQHGAGELFIAIAVYSLIRGLKEEKCIRYAGLALSTAVAIRPANLVIALALSAYVLMEHKKQFTRYLLYATPMALAVMAYSQTYLHSILLMGQLIAPAGLWDNPLLDGLLGLLLSPNKGLLTHSPVLIISIAGMLYSLWRGKEKLLKYLALAVVATVLMWSKWHFWYGGLNLGPRFLIETLPLLCLFLARPAEAMMESRGLRTLLIALVAVSIFINFLGVAVVDYSWNRQQLDEGIALDDTTAVNRVWWNASDLEIVYYTKRLFTMIR
ncbi:MAG: hypothetical protein PHG85_02900 [Candidatus Altiarchaeota archaeon]|nr:hypothetical protein [Candidatus Altiarchaeota archaeon]